MFVKKGIGHIQILVLIAAASVSALCSCNHKDNSPFLFSVQNQYTVSIPAIEGKARPALDVDINVQEVFVSDDDDRGILPNRFISNMLEPFGGRNESTIDENIQTIIEVHSSQYKSFVAEGMENYANDPDAAAHWLSCEFDVKGYPVFNREGILTYCLSKYEYSGGPHGQNDFYYATCSFNKQSEEDEIAYHPISLFDVIDANSMLAFNRLYETLVVKLFGVESAEALRKDGPLFENAELVPCDNFYLSESGVTFVYNVYEIAPYAAGTIEVPVSWEELKPYMPAETPLWIIAQKQN